jgi:chromosome segregation ATPase
MRSVLRLILVVVALVGAHRLWHRQVELLAAKEDLDDERRGIDAAEAELAALDRAIDASEARLRELDAEITVIERRHPAGIPASVHPDYSRLLARRNDAVDEHNALVARHDALRGSYTQRVDRHNARVEEANSLAADGHLCSLLPEWLRRRACGGA